MPAMFFVTLLRLDVRWNQTAMKRAHFPPFSRGFTLTELLVVLVIIAIMISIGIGGWNLLIGSKSVESAQSLTSAVLGRAREEALAVRKSRGVLFFERDAQVYMATVVQDDPAGKPAQLELAADSTIEPLQSGVNCRFISNGVPRYFSPGVLLFDGYGQVSIRAFTVRAVGQLGQAMQLSNDLQGYSSLGITLFQQGRYDGIPDADKDAWLDHKGRSLFVNRYSGTLVEGGGQ